MEQRRRDQVDEEVERTASRTKRQNKEDHKAAKQTVLGILRKLKAEGIIDEALAKSTQRTEQSENKETEDNSNTEQNANTGKGVIDPAA